MENQKQSAEAKAFWMLYAIPSYVIFEMAKCSLGKEVDMGKVEATNALFNNVASLAGGDTHNIGDTLSIIQPTEDGVLDKYQEFKKVCDLSEVDGIADAIADFLEKKVAKSLGDNISDEEKTRFLLKHAMLYNHMSTYNKAVICDEIAKDVTFYQFMETLPLEKKLMFIMTVPDLNYYKELAEIVEYAKNNM